MDAAPILARIAKLLERHECERDVPRHFLRKRVGIGSSCL
jgi:hypothetical protein